MADRNFFIQTWVAPLVIGIILAIIGLVLSNSTKQSTPNSTVVVVDTIKVPVSVPEIHTDPNPKPMPRPEDNTKDGLTTGSENNGIATNDPTTKANPCDQKKTGNVMLKNNTDKVIYVYYNTSDNEFRFVDPLTIKPFESELLYDLPVGQSQEYKVVTNKPATRTSMHYIQGETGGHFSPDPCSTRQFVLDL